MKIGILTFHQSINNGAVVQAYSLSKRLKQEYPDADVEIINYRMEKIDRLYSYSLTKYLKSKSFIGFAKKSFHLLSNPLLLHRMRKQKKVFDGCQHKLPLSKECIVSDCTDELYDYIVKTYDVLIVGSDAVWNYVTRGFPNAYFPSESLKLKKCSYAASCYGMDFLKASEQEREKIGSILSDFEFIGVRDSATEDFVKWSGSEIAPQHTCDPTAFLDVDDLPIDVEALKSKLIKRGFDFNKPTIGMMGTDSMLSMIRNYYGNKYQIVSLYNYVKGADVNLYDLEPYEWAYVFRYFKLTFTTYFHGTLLSLRNGVPVICIALNTEFGKHHTPKTLDLLERLEFDGWYFKTDYQTQNLQEIKATADMLLSGDYRNQILTVINREAESFEIFNSALKPILKKGQTKND